MNLKELQEILIQIGIDPELVEMPAVMERAKRLLADCRDISEVREQISINDSGEVTIDENPLSKHSKNIMTFKKNDNGTAHISIIPSYAFPDEDPISIDTDEFGMDSAIYIYSADESSHCHITRENGSIHYEEYSIIHSSINRNYADNGNACLSHDFEKMPRKRTLESNATYYQNNYPRTKGFFERVRSEERGDDIEL